MLQHSRTAFDRMSNDVEETPGPRVFNPAVSEDISQGSDVNKHQDSINFN